MHWASLLLMAVLACPISAKPLPASAPKTETLDERLANLSTIESNTSANSRLESEISITEHRCYRRTSEEECHQSTSGDSNIECMWCDICCVYRKNPSPNLPVLNTECPEHASGLNKIFPKPVVREMAPYSIDITRPWAITILGSNLEHNTSGNVFNSIKEILFDEIHQCDIHTKNDTTILCILKDVNQTGSISLKVTFTRSVFNLVQEVSLQPNCSLNVMEDAEMGAEAGRPHSWIEINFYTFRAGLFVGTLVCSALWMGFVNRKRAYSALKLFERNIQHKKVCSQFSRLDIFREYKNVTILDKIGDGHFGQVHKARLTTASNRTIEAAVKKLKNASKLHEMKEFRKEASRKFTHDRVLIPISVFIDKSDRMPAIALPLMVNGDLCNYLRHSSPLQMQLLLKFAFQIAEGMEYLSSRNVTHNDLATRNCLLDENLDIKIGDFGMSREVYRQDYEMKDSVPLPTKWMAIERLRPKPKVTKTSDVWSYGVVLWEIFTHGAHPYSELDDKEVKERILNGYRLKQPTNCPQPVFHLMKRCWHENWTRRPLFGYFVNKLKTLTAQVEPVSTSDLSNHCAYSTVPEICYRDR